VVVDHLKDRIGRNNVAIVYIYFDYNDSINQTAEKVIRCILKQFLSQMKDIPEDVESLYDHSNRHSVTPDFRSLSSLVGVCLRSFSSSFLLLDGLDECNSLEMKKLVMSVKQFGARATKVFSTCRPHIANLEANFESTSSLEIIAHEDDIRNYLSHRMDEEWRLSDRLRFETIEQLVSGAQGMFASISN